MMPEKTKILVVEDEPDVRRILAFRLEKAGFEVFASPTGEEGLKEFYERKPDLLILDLMLPGIRGEEVCEIIREDQDEAIRSIPILVLTAKDSIGEKPSRKKVPGANAYMSKPYEFSKLLEEIRNIKP